MKTFEAIFEVWVDSSIKYMVIEMGGTETPKQHAIQDRVNIVEYINENMDTMTARDETTNEVIEGAMVLDLIGVYEDGVKLWHEVAR